MSGTIKKTFYETSIYGAGALSLKLAGIILLPLYTSKIAVSDYGIIGILEVISQLTTILLGLGLPTALFKFLRGDLDKVCQRTIFFSTLAFSLLLAALVTVVSLSVHNTLSRWLFETPLYGILVTLAIADGALFVAVSHVFTHFRIFQKPLLYISTLMARFLVNIGLNIYFVAYRDIGIYGVVYSQLLSTVFVLVLCWPYVLRYSQQRLQMDRLMEMLSFGAPLVFGSVCYFFLNFLDRYLLNELSTLKEVGLYTLGYKLAGFVNMAFVQPFALGFSPVAWKSMNRPDARQFFGKMFTYFVFATVWGVLTLSVFAPEVTRILGRSREYWEAGRVVPFISISYLLYGVAYFMDLGFLFKGKNIQLSLKTFCALVINTILNFVLIPHYGMMGAAWATISAYSVLALLSYRLSQTFYPINYERRRLMLLLMVTILLYGISTQVHLFQVVSQMIIKGLLMLSFPGLLFLVGFYRTDERDVVQKALKKFSSKLAIDFRKG